MILAKLRLDAKNAKRENAIRKKLREKYDKAKMSPEQIVKLKSAIDHMLKMLEEEEEKE